MFSVTALLLSLSSAAHHRCGLAALHPTDADARAGGFTVAFAPRTAANTTGTRLLRTAHFAIWYKTASDSDALSPSLRTIPAKDSVPGIVRAVATALEHARAYYVDTLGLLPPIASTSPGVIAETAPEGLYPIEFCRAERALSKSYWDDSFFGVTVPQTGNSAASRIFLSASILGNGWTYPLDTGDSIKTPYLPESGWLRAMQATAVHELFHAIEFRYETSLTHFLFEANAVAMEDAVLPGVDDHLIYLSQLYGYNTTSGTRPLLQAIQYDAYRHALYVMGLMQDAGPSVVRKLWEDRATRDNSGRTTILGTLRTVLPASGIPLRESIIRYGQRILVSGRRRNWMAHWDTLPAFEPWDRAASAPPLGNILVDPAAGSNSWTLGPGQFKFLSDPDIDGDLRVSWFPSGGAFLVRIDSTPGGFIRETFPTGISTIPAARRNSSLWIVGSDGTTSDANATAYANAVANLSFRQSSPAIPSTDSCLLRTAFPDSSGDSLVLQGCPTTSATSYEMDAFLRSGLIDGAAIDSIASHGSTIVLLSSPTLELRNATLSVPGSWRFAYMRAGTAWKRVAVRAAGARTVLSWPQLSIGDSTAIILSSQSVATAPFPNPSLDNQPVTFPLGADLEGLRLSILAADGSLVRRWGSSELSFNTVWDLRNQYGYRVRPGVYTWVLSGSRNERGRLLVAR